MHHDASPSLVPSRAAIFVLGASTAALQILAVREGMAVAGGNEAVVALFLGVWMLETAVGASIRSKHTERPGHVGLALFVYALAMFCTLAAARASVTWVQPGQAPGLFASAAAAALLLAPGCVLSGWLYAQLARRLAKSDDKPALGEASANAYWLDTLGAGVAGALLALVALDYLLPFRIAALFAMPVVISAARLTGRRTAAAVLTVGAALCLAAFTAPVDRWTYRWHAPGHTIIEASSGPHGAVLVTEAHGQHQVLLQREPVLVPSDRREGEQLAHLTAALHPSPRRVLVIGIPPGNLLENLLLHPVEQIDVVVGELRLARLVHAHAPGARQQRIHIHPTDARAWVRSAPASSYELILILAGAPTTVSGARLFSTSFYRHVARLAAPEGVAVVAMPGFAAYASEPERALHSIVNATLKTSFVHQMVLPADRALHVASRHEAIEPTRAAALIAQRLRIRGVVGEHVTDTWLHDRLSPKRIEQARRWSSRPVEPSTDAYPVVYRAAIEAALARFGDAGSSVLAVLAITLFGLIASWANPLSRPVSFSVAGTGFAGISLQLVLMLVYQTAVGALYRDVALVTAAYMGASCLGTALALRRKASMHRVLVFDAAQVAVAIVIALSVSEMSGWGVGAARTAVVAGALMVGASTGAQISMATRLPGVFGAGVGGAVYAIDLLGAALAALATITFLVPWLGIAGAAWSVAAAKALSSLALARRGAVASDETRRLRVPLPTLLLLAMTVAVILPALQGFVENLTLNTTYHVLALVVLASLLAMAFEPPWLHKRLVRAERRLRSITHRIGVSPLRSVVFLVLLPVAALPLGRCYFVVPYLFCHVCPRPCVFGILRPYVVGAALLTNFGDRRFCLRACPLGHAQAAPAALRSSRPRPFGRVVWGLRILAVVLVTYLYLAAAQDHRKGMDGVGVYAWFFADRYAVSPWVLGVAGAAIVLSFSLRRPFCEAACPIGAVSDLIARLERKWLRGASSAPRA